MLTLESMKRIFSRNKIKEDIKQSETESEDATLQMERIARETENFNTHSKKPSLLARVIAPLYKIFRSSGSQNSVEVVEPQEVVEPKEVAGGVTMFGSNHTEVLKATREVRLRKTADNSAKLSESASQATLVSMEENTDLDGLDLEPLGVDDTDVVTDKELDLLQDRAKKLSESAPGFNRLAAKFAARESSLSLFDRFKGWFSKSKKQSDTEEYNEGSVSDESSLDHETASKPWYRKGALGSTVHWFQSIGHRKGYHVMSECDNSESITSELVGDTDELVQGDYEFTSSTLDFEEISLRSESADGITIESYLDRVNLESDDTPGFTPELSGKEKIGLVQRITNTLKTIGDFLMSPFRASKIVDKDSLSTSSGSLTSLASQERSATPPPSYEEAIGAMEGRKSPFQRLWNSANGLIEKYIITPIRSLLSERDNVNSTEEGKSVKSATFRTEQGKFKDGHLCGEVDGYANPLVAEKESTQKRPQSWTEKHSRGSKASWREKANTIRHSDGKLETHL